MFLLDKIKFIRNFIPPRRRQLKQLAWARVMVWHVFDLWTELYNYWLEIEFDLQNNIGTDVFQTRLRTLYPDVGAFKCFVKNQHNIIPSICIQYRGEHHAPKHIFLRSEGEPPTYLKLRSELQLDYDYHIVIPTTYQPQMQAITSLCNKYKPAGKRYLLIFDDITI